MTEGQPIDDLAVIGELETIRLRPRGDIFVDLFKQFGPEEGQEMCTGIGSIQIVRKIPFEEMDGAVVLERLQNNHLVLSFFRYHTLIEGYDAFLSMRNLYVEWAQGKEYPVINVEMRQPIFAGTPQFHLALRVLNEMQEYMNRQGFDPRTIEWQRYGADEKR